MQDIHMLGTGSGGGGRIFGAGIDRRLRTQNHQQALKCPRCDSLNTKFCYYNNYNLSQPRHFCKGCRRYWTKGGVLRNVPVGGGCRKAKRSAKPKRPPSAVAALAAEPEDNSNSSSESSSLTNTTTTAAAEVISGGSSSNSCPALFNFAAEDQIFVPQIANASFDQANFIDHASDGGGSMFPEIGRFTEMMTSPADIGFTVADVSAFRSENQKNDEDNRRSDEVQQMHDMASGGYLDQTVQIESGDRISNVDVAGVEWQSGGVNNDQDEGIFDLTGTVDQAYWSQPQWPDHHSDHSTFHYLP